MKKSEKNNFARVVDWLRVNGFIHNQKDLANRIGSTETTISRNKHGNVGRTDEETLAKFNAVFGDTINIAYLRGESEVMLVADLHQQERINTCVNLQSKPVSHTCETNQGVSCTDKFVNATLAAKDETIAALKHELDAKDETIAALRDQIADKERYISSLQQQLRDLRESDRPQKVAPHTYHYPGGVAEYSHRHPEH